MIDMTILASGTVVAAFAATVVGYISRLWYNYRQLMVRVDILEKEKVNYLMAAEHERDQKVCRVGIYRDISTLEDAIKRVETRMDKGEDARDKAREEDQKWKEHISSAVTEISVILKNELFQRNNNSKYEGP